MVRIALLGFVRAHIDLAKAEMEQVGREIGRASGLAAAAIALLILMSLLVAIGGMLFAGEWLFGSIGWGLLLGTELLIAVALAAVLVALYVPGLGRDALIAILPGIAVALILALNLPNELFKRIGESANLAVDPAVLPLVVGVVLVGVFGALVGLFTGARAGGAKGAFGGLFVGALAGALLGAFLSITFGLRVGIALGIATFFAAWSALMGLRVQRQGIDVEALKTRFIPQTTIDTTKESIEWAKARVGREPKSRRHERRSWRPARRGRGARPPRGVRPRGGGHPREDQAQPGQDGRPRGGRRLPGDRWPQAGVPARQAGRFGAPRSRSRRPCCPRRSTRRSARSARTANGSGVDRARVRGLPEGHGASHAGAATWAARSRSCRCAFLRPLVLRYSKHLADQIFSTDAKQYDDRLHAVRVTPRYRTKAAPAGEDRDPA